MFKVVVIVINYRKIEQQLLFKSTIALVLRLAIKSVFTITNFAIIDSLQTLRTRYLQFFKKLLLLILVQQLKNLYNKIYIENSNY